MGQFADSSANPITGLFDLRKTVRLISKADDVHSACLYLKSLLADNKTSLFGVTFCDLQSGSSSIRAFCGYPEALQKMSSKLKVRGTCPIVNESIRLGRTFDLLQVDRDQYSDFLGKRYFEELEKLGHRHVAVVPLMLGRGLAIFTIGTNDRHLDGDLKSLLINSICQTTFAIIDRFPNVTKLFEARNISTVEAEALLLCSNGYSNSEISEFFGLSETTVTLMFDNASRKLGTRNQAHAVAKAVAIGEISNLHLGEHELF